MSDDYYDAGARPGTDEQLAESGWRREIGQLVRFEAALAPWDWDEIGSVLDLGCGPARLARYMAETGRSARYVGVESRASAVEYARRHAPQEAEIRQGDLYDGGGVDDPFDLVVAIGAQVDGRPAEDDADRVGRVRRLIERCDDLAERGAAVFLLDQTTLRERPVLRLEPALFGITREEMTGILEAFSPPWSIRDDVLETDLGVYLSDGSGVYRSSALAGARVHESVAERHLDRGGAREDVAWMWLEAGRPERAREVLEKLVDSRGETDEIRHLLGRLS